MVAVFKGLNTLQSMFTALEEGDFSTSLGDIEMRAARSSFAAIPRTNDKRSQVWTCIGHLNSAHHAYEKYIRSRTRGNISITRIWCDGDANAKRTFVLLLKAICYKYLGEEKLCEEAIAASDQLETLSEMETVVVTAFSAASLFTFALAEVAYCRIRGIGSDQKEYAIDEETKKRLIGVLKG
jgi:hypothetical protein